MPVIRLLLILLALPSAVPANPATLLDRLREQTGIPGMAAAVSIDGRLAWHGESGFADIEARRPVSPDTRFRLASVSKFVCSIMAAEVVADELLALDTRAGDVLPTLPRQYHELTLRDLLTHTSGLPHYQPRDSNRGETHYASAIDGLAQLGDRPLIARPGEQYVYSTHGFSLASAMLEAATGRNFIELFDEIAGAGIALESEAMAVAKASDDRSRIYAGAGDELEREDFSYSWCGAGMEATATALSNYVSAVFSGPDAIDRTARRLLIEPLDSRDGTVVDAGRWTMTLGVRRSTDATGDVYVHHAGVTNGARSIVAVWPARGLAVALLSNASWTGRMEDTAVALGLAATAAVDEPGCAPGAADYVGRLRDEPLEARIEWSPDPEGCRGRLTGDNALTSWTDGFNFGGADGPMLIPLGRERWGLVTPIGIAILSGNQAALTGLVGSRQLSLQRNATQGRP